LKIHDPDNSLRSRRRRGRGQTEADGSTTNDEGSDDELANGIEAYLVMKLVCKHGKLSDAFDEDKKLIIRRNQEAFFTSGHYRVPTSRRRSRYHSIWISGSRKNTPNLA
jgi:hypothetical protein